MERVCQNKLRTADQINEFIGGSVLDDREGLLFIQMMHRKHHDLQVGLFLHHLSVVPVCLIVHDEIAKDKAVFDRFRILRFIGIGIPLFARQKKRRIDHLCQFIINDP